MTLTASQRLALAWMRDFPSTRAEWCENGERLRPKRWNHANTMKLSGPRGSIIIPIDDWKALHGLFIGCPSPDKIYGPNEAGLASLADNGGGE